MPRRALKVCGTSGCPELTSTANCPAHTPKPWAASTRRQRLPKDWQKRVRQVKRRDRNTCQACGKPAPDGDVDHIVPGDNHDLANLQLLCAGKTGCHAAKTKAERIAARWPGSSATGTATT